jgi:heme exporter protein C
VVYGKGLRALSIAAALVLVAASVLIFFYAPLDADQGVIQKIFYVHVPLAIVSLCGFIAGGVLAIKQLRTGTTEADMRSYVAIHLSLIFATGALITGSIWAKASWGHWWTWDEPVLVSFLIVFLLYCCYQPLRFSIEDPERQARYASVFAIAAGAFVPINFMAVRLATAHIHPRVLSKTTGGMPSEMFFTFLVSIAGVALLWLTMWKLELTSKNASLKLKRLRRRLEAEPPAAAQPEPEPALTP